MEKQQEETNQDQPTPPKVEEAPEKETKETNEEDSSKKSEPSVERKDEPAGTDKKIEEKEEVTSTSVSIDEISKLLDSKLSGSVTKDQFKVIEEALSKLQSKVEDKDDETNNKQKESVVSKTKEESASFTQEDLDKKAAELEARLEKRAAELAEQLEKKRKAEELASYRAAKIKENEILFPEAVTGKTVEEIDKSVAAAVAKQREFISEKTKDITKKSLQSLQSRIPRTAQFVVGDDGAVSIERKLKTKTLKERLSEGAVGRGRRHGR